MLLLVSSSTRDKKQKRGQGKVLLVPRLSPGICFQDQAEPEHFFFLFTLFHQFALHIIKYPRIDSHLAKLTI